MATLIRISVCFIRVVTYQACYEEKWKLSNCEGIWQGMCHSVNDQMLHILIGKYAYTQKEFVF